MPIAPGHSHGDLGSLHVGTELRSGGIAKLSRAPSFIKAEMLEPARREDLNCPWKKHS